MYVINMYILTLLVAQSTLGRLEVEVTEWDWVDGKEKGHKM